MIAHRYTDRDRLELLAAIVVNWLSGQPDGQVDNDTELAELAELTDAILDRPRPVVIGVPGAKQRENVRLDREGAEHIDRLIDGHVDGAHHHPNVNAPVARVFRRLDATPKP